MRLIKLSDSRAADRRRTGGKAAALAALAGRGVPVPAGVVVPPEALEVALREAGLLEAALAGDRTVATRLRSVPLPRGLGKALDRAADELGGPLAVRSSGLSEDGVEASYAGQFDSVLGVRGGAPLRDAVRHCWASAFTQRASSYRRRGRGLPQMAVLVQRLIDPVCAGVMFTINPASGSWREMTIEAAWGLGDAVASGTVMPDHYRVKRPRRVPRPIQRVLARVRLRVVEDTVRPQETALHCGPDGLEERRVAAPQVEAPKLLHAEVLKLCRLGLRVEGLRGAPQDIEWARDGEGTLYILQARPVTTARDIRRSGPVLWTRRFVGERWTQPATPLGWSLMRQQLDWFIGYPETSRRYLGGGEPTRLLRFSPYLNVTVFRHLAFKPPGAPPPRFMLELLPPDEASRWRRRRGAWPDLRVYRSILQTTLKEKRWQRFRWNPVRNCAHWDAFEGRLDEALAEMRPITDRDTARRRSRQCAALVRAYLGVHVCSLLFANIWFELAEGMLGARGLDAHISTLLRPSAPTWTARTNHALWALARGETDEPSVLAEFGHRAPSSWELFSPRWREDPAQLRALARGLMGRPDPLVGAVTAVAQADAMSRQLPGDLRPVVTLARRYLRLREDQRFHFDRLLWRWKEAWLWLEGDTGLALRFLESDEADALLDQDLGLARAEALIARREAAWRAEQERRACGDAPPVFLVGEAAADAPAGGARLNGQGISAGVVRGTVRIVNRLEDGERLRSGEILVAAATDPGWTPLFGRAAGLVLEMGGMLSHGAVVAREYGLPGVVNVASATQRLSDGQVVTVDGGRGLVFVH